MCVFTCIGRYVNLHLVAINTFAIDYDILVFSSLFSVVIIMIIMFSSPDGFFFFFFFFFLYDCETS